ncbi:MAG: methionine--tRNA ligase [Candidatus Aenigmarchaeota archaeon]|nr:methionine--tRNA ligase [Candidatus Aenigmarchaeota archaeon]
MSEKILITAALPYANGPIHLGHLVEYVQADIFSRFLKLKGYDAIYCCADDQHGTPIEVNAMKQKITPEEFIKRWLEQHKTDFSAFHIDFDSYYETNSPENKKHADFFFTTLKDKGFIHTKEVDQLYCENDKRFLPDRFVKGVCPKCGAEDQYGDVCEVCGASYNATEISQPKCVICGNSPVVRKSSHYFFRLGSFSEKLRKWLTENQEMQSDIRNYVLSWIDKGLEDWCVSRDAPYFGFKIPGEADKYYYVWLDAPIGYISSTENYCKKRGIQLDDYWRKKDSKIYHFIGKDIAYFHFLFWPAMLMGTGFNLPHNIIVHGFLTVNKEKMSKSRGTFIKASEYIESGLDPEFLRYHYASSLTKSTVDIDLSFEDFQSRVNTELVGNIANLAYRCLSFTSKNFNGKLGKTPAGPGENVIIEQVRDLKRKIDSDYMSCDYRSVVKSILEVGDIGNKYFQENAPWELIKTDKTRCREVLAFTANIVKNLAIMLQPILPDFSDSLRKQLGIQGFFGWEDINFDLEEHQIGEPEIVLRKIEEINIGPPKEEPEKDADPFSRLDLRVAKIEKVEQHPDAEKLYIEQIDVGGKKRQIVSGLKGHYKPKELEGKRIILVANLKPAKLRGVESDGMLLAVESKDKKVGLLTSKDEPGEHVFIEGMKQKPAKEIDIKEFAEMKMLVSEGKVLYKGKIMKTKNGELTVDRKIDGVVC